MLHRARCEKITNWHLFGVPKLSELQESRTSSETTTNSTPLFAGGLALQQHISFGRWQNLNRVKPNFHALRPGGYRQRGSAETVAVPSLSIKMHFLRDFSVLECEEIDGGVFHVYRIVFSLHDERRRRFPGNVNLGIGRKVLLRKCKIAGINDHRKVRAAAHFIRGINGIVETLIEVC